MSEQIGGLGQPVDVGGQPPGVIQIPQPGDSVDVPSTPDPDIDAVFAGSGSGQFLLSLRHMKLSNRYPVSSR